MYSPNESCTTKHKRSPSFKFSRGSIDMSAFSERRRSTMNRQMFEKLTKKKYGNSEKSKMSSVFQVICDKSKIQRDSNEKYQRGFQKFSQLRIKKDLGKNHVRLIPTRRNMFESEFIMK